MNLLTPGRDESSSVGRHCSDGHHAGWHSCGSYTRNHCCRRLRQCLANRWRGWKDQLQQVLVWIINCIALTSDNSVSFPTPLFGLHFGTIWLADSFEFSVLTQQGSTSYKDIAQQSHKSMLNCEWCYSTLIIFWSFGHCRAVLFNIPLFLLFPTFFTFIGILMYAHFHDCDPLRNGDITKPDQVPL